MGSHKPEALRASHGLRSFFSTKLYEDVLDVRCNRFRSNGEVPRDFLVGKASGAKGDNGTFTCAEWIRDAESRTQLDSRCLRAVTRPLT
jgi:hypothetical protein